MNDRDHDTFEAFAARFAAVEAVVPDRPVVRPRVRGADRRSRSATMVVVLLGGIAVLVAGVAAGSQLFIARPVASSPGNGSVVAVASPPAATASPVPTDQPSKPNAVVPLDPVTPPATLPPPCGTRYTTYDRLVTSPAQDAARSRSVVIGRVAGVGAAQWNTVGGGPAGRYQADVFDVIRLVRVEVETTVQGVATPSEITVWIIGGTIGCTDFRLGGEPDVKIGDRLIFFLNDEAPKTGLSGVFHAWQMWAIDGGTVTTEFVPHLPLADVLDQLRADPASSGTP